MKFNLYSCQYRQCLCVCVCVCARALGLPTLLFNGYWAQLFVQVWRSQGMKLTTYLHFVPKLRMCGTLPALPHAPSCMDSDNFTLLYSTLLYFSFLYFTLLKTSEHVSLILALYLPCVVDEKSTCTQMIETYFCLSCNQFETYFVQFILW